MTIRVVTKVFRYLGKVEIIALAKYNSINARLKNRLRESTDKVRDSRTQDHHSNVHAHCQAISEFATEWIYVELLSLESNKRNHNQSTKYEQK